MAPTRIGRFEIIAELGKHPLGMLYKANDPKRGQIALLAIESASLTSASRQQVQQLFTRARTATLLNSPNIASIFGGGEADGYVHLAMEFVDGVTLRTQMARDGRVSSSELIDIARQLCTALDHAQSKGVVHQNLHPGNVKVEWDGAVKLMDYGLDITSKHGPDDPALFYAHRYASPEQLRGEPVTHKSNLYTLGAMLYELASGRKAIAVEENERVCDEVLNGDVVPARTACPEVPEVVSDAIARAMAKNPADRFESAAALVRDLENIRTVKKPMAPVVAPIESPASSTAKQKPTYGSPDNSAIFRAMNDNFKQSGAPGNGRTAVAEPPHEPAPAFQQSAQEYLGPIGSVAAQVLQASAYTPRPTSVPVPEPVAPAVRPSTVDPVTVDTRCAAESSTQSQPASTRPVRPAISAPPKLTRTATKSATPAAKARFVLPEPRKLGLIAAGMAFAVVALWGISRVNNSQAEAAPAQNVVTREQTSPEPQLETPTTASVPEQDSQQPEVVVRDFKTRRASRKPTQVAVATPAVLTGDLFVTSVPEGAQIQIDGRGDAQWVTPQALTGIPLGEHTVTLLKPGYTTVIKSVEVAANQRPVISVALQQIAEILSIASDPAGARIYVDDRDTGKLTPAQLTVGPGSHQVTLKKDGYFDYAGTATAQGNQTVALSASLVQAGRTDRIESASKLGKLFGRGGNPEMGRLRVKTEPKGAYITINGKPAPDASPSEFLLNPGTYEVRMQLTGRPDIRRTVQIIKGKRVELDEQFNPR